LGNILALKQVEWTAPYFRVLLKLFIRIQFVPIFKLVTKRLYVLLSILMFLLKTNTILLLIYNRQPSNFLQKLQIIAPSTDILIKPIPIILIPLAPVPLTARKVIGVLKLILLVQKVPAKIPDRIWLLKYSFLLISGLLLVLINLIKVDLVDRHFQFLVKILFLTRSIAFHIFLNNAIIFVILRSLTLWILYCNLLYDIRFFLLRLINNSVTQFTKHHDNNLPSWFGYLDLLVLSLLLLLDRLLFTQQVLKYRFILFYFSH